MRLKIGTSKIDLADELEEAYAKAVRGVHTKSRAVMLKHAHQKIEQRGMNGPAPPGETPATFTGNLKKLTKPLPVWVRSRGRYASSGIIYAPHAHLLEYGHENLDGTRTLPRPFIGPATEAAEAEIEAIIREGLG